MQASTLFYYRLPVNCVWIPANDITSINCEDAKDLKTITVFNCHDKAIKEHLEKQTLLHYVSAAEYNEFLKSGRGICHICRDPIKPFVVTYFDTYGFGEWGKKNFGDQYLRCYKWGTNEMYHLKPHIKKIVQSILFRSVASALNAFHWVVYKGTSIILAPPVVVLITIFAPIIFAGIAGAYLELGPALPLFMGGLFLHEVSGFHGPFHWLMDRSLHYSDKLVKAIQPTFTPKEIWNRALERSIPAN